MEDDINVNFVATKNTVPISTPQPESQKNKKSRKNKREKKPDSEKTKLKQKIHRKQENPKPLAEMPPKPYIKPNKKLDEKLERIEKEKNELAENDNEEQKNEAKRDIFSITKFDELPICDKLKASLRENNYSIMTNIQQRAIPAILSNQFVLVKSETGSGKTFAYLIPILQKLYELSISNQSELITRDKGAYAIIFAPTRELAIQIYESCLKLTRRMSFVVCGALMGGEPVKKEKARVRKGLNIIIATPGRLLYHLQNTKAMAMPNLKFIVFDEADRMLDMGFEKEVKGCIDSIKEYMKEKFNPVSIILAAATTGGRLTDLVQNIMNNYVSVGFEQDADATVQVPTSIQQFFTVIPAIHKLHYLLAFLFCKHGSKVIVFMSTCQEVNYLFELVKTLDWKEFAKENKQMGEEFRLFKDNVYKLHGDMEHGVRKKMFAGFNTTKSGILISTDVAARGLDFQGVRWILHYDINREIKEYVNRIGRTARLNTDGRSLLFIMDGEKGYIDMLKDCGLTLKSAASHAILTNFKEAIDKNLGIKCAERGRDLENFLITNLRTFVKQTIARDKALIQLALGAYRSSISSFASRSLKDKKIFNYKDINFTDLAKGFGVAKEWAQADRQKQYMYHGLDKLTQGRAPRGDEISEKRNFPEGNKMEQMAQQKAKKMEDIIKKMNKSIKNSLDL